MASFISLQFGKQFCIPSFSNIDLKELYSVLFKILQITYLFSHYITSYYKFFKFFIVYSTFYCLQSRNYIFKYSFVKFKEFAISSIVFS